MFRCRSDRRSRSVIVGPLDHVGERTGVVDERRQQLQGTLGEVFSVIVRCGIAVVTVAQPPLGRLAVDEIVAGRMAEEVLEMQAVGLAVAGEPGGDPLAQQFSALFEHEFELLDARGAVDVVHEIVRVVLFVSLRRPLERGDAAAQEGRVDGYGSGPPSPMVFRFLVIAAVRDDCIQASCRSVAVMVLRIAPTAGA